MVLASARGADQSVKEIGPKVYRHVMIRAGDGNQDGLSFDIECRRLDHQAWVKIVKKLAEPRFIWDTRTLGDGAYELRITASDSPNNPPGQALTAVRLAAGRRTTPPRWGRRRQARWQKVLRPRTITEAVS